MTEPTLNPIPDSGGLYALPVDGLDRIAAACIAARGGKAKPPTNQVDRVNLWRLMNETMAEAVANADDTSADLARLEAALGLTDAAADKTTPTSFDIERRRLAARSKARAACAALLDSGYQP